MKNQVFVLDSSQQKLKLFFVFLAASESKQQNKRFVLATEMVLCFVFAFKKDYAKKVSSSEAAFSHKLTTICSSDCFNFVGEAVKFRDMPFLIALKLEASHVSPITISAHSNNWHPARGLQFNSTVAMAKFRRKVQRHGVES